MYKTKPCFKCEMPFPETKPKVLVLNASLKHKPEISNTGEVAELVVENMKGQIDEAEIIGLADRTIPVGLGFR